MKHDLFISYSRKDFNEVRYLLEHLHDQIPELKCWFDMTGIESASEFEDKIISAITESSYVLFALSDNSMNSPWTKDEVTYAKNIGKKVIPVLLKGATLKEGWFLFKFGRIDCIDSSNELQMQKLVRDLSEWTKKPISTITTSYQSSQRSQESVAKKPKKIDKILRKLKDDIRFHMHVLKMCIIDEWLSNIIGVSLGLFFYYKLIAASLICNLHMCLFVLMCISMIISLYCYIIFYRKACILSVLLVAIIFCLGTSTFNIGIIVGFLGLMLVLYYSKIWLGI